VNTTKAADAKHQIAKRNTVSVLKEESPAQKNVNAWNVRMVSMIMMYIFNHKISR